MQASPDFTKKSLLRASKNVVQQQDQDEMLQGLRELDKQGHMSRCTDPEGAQVWAEAVEGMVDENVKFALNSAVDTLPHNANLALWKKRMNDACTLCGERQTLIHILNTCAVAHDSLLREILAIIMIYLPSNAHLTWVSTAFSSILWQLISAQTLCGGMTLLG